MSIMTDDKWHNILFWRLRKRYRQVANHELAFCAYIINYCNLNCHGCSRWCNITKNRLIYKYDDVCRDSLNILSKTKNTIFFGYSGGEPLIHPEITGLCEFLGDCRKKFNIPYVSLATNCKRLLKMPDEFFKAMREGQIHLVFSLYPGSKINYEECFKRLKDEHIDFNNFTEIDRQPIDDLTEEFFPTQFVLPANYDKKAGAFSYIKCGVVCPNIWMGNIYKCCNLSFIQTVNDNFDAGIELKPDDDYIPVEKYTEDSYFKWLAKPSHFCSAYCHQAKTLREPWHIGKNIKEEIIQYKTE